MTVSRIKRPGGRSRRGRLVALLATPLLATSLAPAAATSNAAAQPLATVPASATAEPTHKVTLVTGDTVTYGVRADGQAMFDAVAAPREDGRTVTFSGEGTRDHFYVYPTDVVPYVVSGVVDRELFNVPKLVAQGLDSASTDTLPVIVGYDQATAASQRELEQQADALPATTHPVGVRAVEAAGVEVDLDEAHLFWAALTDRPAKAGAAQLEQGVTKLRLDQRLKVTLDESVPQIGAPQAWAAGYTGKGVTVAVLDTGIDATHPDLTGKVVDAVDFTGENSTADPHGHGTHVASTIAGTGAASDGRYKGVAPDAQLLNGRVCDAGGLCQISHVMSAMEWAASNGADIVNMSIGGALGDGTDEQSQLLNELTAKHDTLFVVAAGNSGPEPRTVTIPGVADAALTVGAVDKANQLAGFSSRGPRQGNHAFKPEITAPGVDIVAARAEGTDMSGGTPVDEHYVPASGTSMATPHVAGAAALLAQARPKLAAPQLKDALAATAADGGYRWFEQGSGRVDVPRAVNQGVYAQASANFGELVDQTGAVARDLVYTNTTDTPVTLQLQASVTDRDGNPVDSFTLSTSTVMVPAQGSASITATVNADSTPPGAFGGVVSATADGVSLRTGVAFGKAVPQHDVTIKVLDSHGNAPEFPWGVMLIHDDFDPVAQSGEPAYGLPVVDGGAQARVPAGVYTAITTVYEGDASTYNWTRVSKLVEVEVEVNADTTITLDARNTVETAATVPKESAVRGHSVSVARKWWNLPDSYSIIERPDGRYPVFVSPAPATEKGFISLHDAWVLAEPQPINELPNSGGRIRYSPTPAYAYHLQFAYRNGIPGDLRRTVTDADLVHIPTEYHAENPEGTVMRQGAFGVSANAGAQFNHTVWIEPGAVDESYLADDHVAWQKVANLIRWPAPLRQYTHMQTMFDVFRAAEAGRTRPVERWFDGPVRVGAVDTPPQARDLPVWWYQTLATMVRGGRDGNWFVPGIEPMDSTPGHGVDLAGPASQYATWRMWNLDTGAELPVDWGIWQLYPVFHLAEQPAKYRLEAVATPPARRVGDLFRSAPTTTTAWTFQSERSDAQVPKGYACAVPNGVKDGQFVYQVCQFQTPIQLRYELGLDLQNRARAGRTHVITVHAGSHSQAPDRSPVTALTLEYSTDGGRTWSKARMVGKPRDDLSPIGERSFKALITHPPLHRTDGFVWVRVSAKDAGGGTVEQTVQRAYILK